MGNEAFCRSISLLSQRAGKFWTLVCTYSDTIECALAHMPQPGMCSFSRKLYKNFLLPRDLLFFVVRDFFFLRLRFSVYNRTQQQCTALAAL